MSDDLADTATSADNGFSLQAAWLGAPSVLPSRATRTTAHFTRPTCTRHVRQYLMAASSPVTLRELSQETGYRHEEIGSCLVKLVRGGNVACSERENAGARGPAPKGGKNRTYWWADPSAGEALTRRCLDAAAQAATRTRAAVAGSGTDGGGKVTAEKPSLTMAMLS